MENVSGLASWRIAPPPIPESEIKEEYSTDVLVVGLGNAGTPATRAAAEAGASVIAIEKMEKKKYRVWGEDIGHINSDFLAGKGVPRVDPIEFFNEWMRRSGNRANPKLVMQFCQNCGEMFDWFIEPLNKEQIDSIRVEYWPLGKRFAGQISGQKFWAGTAEFPGGLFYKGNFNLLRAILANQEMAKDKGAKLHFGIDAQQLVMSDNNVVGVIARDSKGQYLRYKANKGVILAAGDFAGNKEMRDDLLLDISDLFDDGEHFTSFGRDGRGIQMGVWAGGRLEARPIAVMRGNHQTLHGVIATFGALWVDEAGKRYCNEGFGDPVFAGFPGAQEKRGTNTIVFDSSVLDDLQSGPPAHTSFFINDNSQERFLKNSMAEARKMGAKGYAADRGRSHLYAADTLEELADYVGFNGIARRNFLATIKRYNRFCATGRDEDFGKDVQLLNAVDTPPYYAEPKEGSDIGNMMVTCGGLLTNEYQNVLNQKRDPIPGLYATGNCCGRRFGLQYSTPIAGVSIGIAMTLGREAGKIVANL